MLRLLGWFLGVWRWVFVSCEGGLLSTPGAIDLSVSRSNGRRSNGTANVQATGDGAAFERTVGNIHHGANGKQADESAEQLPMVPPLSFSISWTMPVREHEHIGGGY
jgi:hypothetical protein